MDFTGVFLPGVLLSTGASVFFSGALTAWPFLEESLKGWLDDISFQSFILSGIWWASWSSNIVYGNFVSSSIYFPKSSTGMSLFDRSPAFMNYPRLSWRYSAYSFSAIYLSKAESSSIICLEPPRLNRLLTPLFNRLVNRLPVLLWDCLDIPSLDSSSYLSEQMSSPDGSGCGSWSAPPATSAVLV